MYFFFCCFDGEPLNSDEETKEVSIHGDVMCVISPFFVFDYFFTEQNENITNKSNIYQPPEINVNCTEL